MNKLKTIIAALLMITAVFTFVSPTLPVSAQSPLEDVCATNSDSPVCQRSSESSDKFVSNLVNTLLFIVGMLAVLGIIIGGIYYVTSAGDSSNVTKAKNTILYSVIGLLVSVLAFAIVRFVETQF
jgi:small-conductance mechanosensitive channel